MTRAAATDDDDKDNDNDDDDDDNDDDNDDGNDNDQGRGSNNPNTGPQRDHASFATNRVTGAFAFIEAGHPRRPGDKALLMSEEFPATAEVSHTTQRLKLYL